jgi:hypothetical protein
MVQAKVLTEANVLLNYFITFTLLLPYIFDYTNLIQTNVLCFILFNTTFY